MRLVSNFSDEEYIKLYGIHPEDAAIAHEEVMKNTKEKNWLIQELEEAQRLGNTGKVEELEKSLKRLIGITPERDGIQNL